MIHKRIKRWSLLLALSLCVSGLPVSAMAEPTNEFAIGALQEAIPESLQESQEAMPEETPESTKEATQSAATEDAMGESEIEFVQDFEHLHQDQVALYAAASGDGGTISGNSYPTGSLGRKRYKFDITFSCSRCKQTFPTGTDDGQHKCIANLFTYTVQGNQLIYKWEIQVRSCDGTSKKMSYNDDLTVSCSKTHYTYYSINVGDYYNGKGGSLKQYVYYYSVPHTGEASCISSANCTMCGESYLAGHNYGTEWTIGETTHYQSCQTEGCTAYSVAEPHSYNDYGMCACGGMEPAVLNGDTYEIANAGQLAWYGSHHGDYPGVLVQDITIGSQNAPYEGWTPVTIGGGVFDGQGHTITMYLNGTDSLFGSSGVIYQNMTLKGAMTTSSNGYVGAIVGNGYGVRLNRILSYVDITNTGSGYVGGLIGNFGQQGDLAKINQCGVYADIVSRDAEGNPAGHVGGLVGHGWDQTRYWLIYHSAFYGTVTGGEGTTGAMLGYSGTNKRISYCKISNCYYPEGYQAVGGGYYDEGNIQAEAKRAEAFASGEVAWLLNEKTNNGTWKQILGKDTLPTLKGKGVYYGYIHCGLDAEKVYSNCSWASNQTQPDHTFNDDAICDFCRGYDAPEKIDGVYQIVKLGHLGWYGQNGNGTIAVLCSDLTIGSEETPYEDWVPVSVGGHAVFDGQGHKITMYLTTYNVDKEAERQHVGLFAAGYCTIRNLTLEGAITCNSSGGGNDSSPARVGAVSPSGFGVTFEQVLSYVKVTNLGTAPTGGIVGYFGGGGATIKNCAVYADISGTGQVGGLVGAGWNGNQAWKIQNCAYWGDLTGAAGKTGALMGYSETDKGTNSSSIQNSYYRSIYASVGGGDNASALANINQSEGKDQSAFASGVVAWKLNEQSANGIWKQDLGSQPYPIFTGASVNFNNYEAGEGEDIVRVAISWGNMSFTYHMGEWDPTTHQYVGEKYWATEGENNRISIYNSGKPIYATLDYTSSKEGITGTLDQTRHSLETNTVALSKLTISGTPEGEPYTNAPLGTVTVTISEQPNMTGLEEGDEITYLAKDGKAYVCVLVDVRDGNYVLITKTHVKRYTGNEGVLNTVRADAEAVGASLPEVKIGKDKDNTKDFKYLKQTVRPYGPGVYVAITKVNQFLCLYRDPNQGFVLIAGCENPYVFYEFKVPVS